MARRRLPYSPFRMHSRPPISTEYASLFGPFHVERRLGYKPSGTVRYTELSPTGSETSGTDRQSEIVAAINGPICCGLEAKKLNHFSRACMRSYVSREGRAWPSQLVGSETPGVPLVFVPYTGGGCSASEMRSRGLCGVVSRQRPGMDVAGTNKTRWTSIVGMISSKLSRFRSTGRQSESSQQLMGEPCCGPRGEKFDYFSRACMGAPVSGAVRGRPDWSRNPNRREN